MTPISHPSGFSEQRIVWAIALSFILHATVAIILPSIKFNAPKPPDVLTIELYAPKTPEPVATPEPKPAPIPEPPKPQPKPAPLTKPLPKPRIVTPNPIAETQVSTPDHSIEAPPPAVIAAEPKTDSPPAFTAPPPPPPEPPKPSGPSDDDINAARERYGNMLQREIAKHKQYPRIAHMRGWQGEVIVEISIDGNGNVLGSKIQTPSSYDALDKQALEMVKKASPFPAPPAALQGRSFNILVPVSFRLE